LRISFKGVKYEVEKAARAIEESEFADGLRFAK